MSAVPDVSTDGADRRVGAGPLARHAWRPAAHPTTGVAVRYQPILDVARGVAAGYQAQVAAGDELDVTRPWPLSSDTDGRLTASVVRTALAAAATLPPNTFLTVPVPVETIGLDVVRRALLEGRPGAAGGPSRRLTGVILDLVGPIDFSHRDELLVAVAPLRAAGAMLSVGGYGAPQPELSSILSLRPAVVRLGRDWVRGIDTSSAKRSALEAIGAMADQLDAWILVEGVAGVEELRVLCDLRVPLAQGPFVGEAHTVWPGISASVRSDLPALPEVTDGSLRALMQPARTATDAMALTAAMPKTSSLGVVVVVSDDGRPTTVVEQDDHDRWCAWEAMTVHVDTSVDDVVLRALTRPRSSRYAPVVCTSSTGQMLGVLRMERLISHLARRG